MNKILKITTVFLSIFFVLSSCKKEVTETSITNDNYYVKYKISSNYPSIFSNWSVTTPQGNYTKNNYQTRLWEETYGPVKKGFKCVAQVQNGAPTIEIYVSKNNSPFALKATKSGGTLSYTIDY